jgi:hypothetical protein
MSAASALIGEQVKSGEMMTPSGLLASLSGLSGLGLPRRVTNLGSGRPYHVWHHEWLSERHLLTVGFDKEDSEKGAGHYVARHAIDRGIVFDLERGTQREVPRAIAGIPIPRFSPDTFVISPDQRSIIRVDQKQRRGVVASPFGAFSFPFWSEFPLAMRVPRLSPFIVWHQDSRHFSVLRMPGVAPGGRRSLQSNAEIVTYDIAYDIARGDKVHDTVRLLPLPPAAAAERHPKFSLTPRYTCPQLVSPAAAICDTNYRFWDWESIPRRQRRLAWFTWPMLHLGRNSGTAGPLAASVPRKGSLRFPPSIGEFRELAYAPDGRRVLLCFSPAHPDRNTFWLGTADGAGSGSMRLVARQSQKEWSASEGTHDLRWRPDGKASSFQYDGDVYVMPLPV